MMDPTATTQVKPNSDGFGTKLPTASFNAADFFRRIGRVEQVLSDVRASMKVQHV